MSDDKCACGHWAMDHNIDGCEACMCERFKWPISVPDQTRRAPSGNTDPANINRQ